MSNPAVFGASLVCSIPGLPPETVIFGQTPVMIETRKKVEKVAGTNIPVLVQGESGSGKEVLANLIHRRSPWNNGPFVKISCPAIPSALMESELFGYEKGAFTGAYGAKPGRVEMAHRGTLFLDEIAELDPGLQAKLLQLLQDSQFCRIGAQEDKRVEVRVVCATNRRLLDEIEAGRFRQDLFYRINVVNILLPPLRERKEDIPGLVSYFLDHYCETYSAPARPISSALLRLMQKYHWPGNIRQLENIIKRYVVFGSEEAITNEFLGQLSGHFEAEIPAGASISLKSLTRQAVQDLERKIILRALQAQRWNRKEVARSLNISYRTLLYKIRQSRVPSDAVGGT